MAIKMPHTNLNNNKLHLISQLAKPNLCLKKPFKVEDMSTCEYHSIESCLLKKI